MTQLIRESLESQRLSGLKIVLSFTPASLGEQLGMRPGVRVIAKHWSRSPGQCSALAALSPPQASPPDDRKGHEMSGGRSEPEAHWLPGLLLSPRYALGGVGFLQGLQILFEPWQQACNRIGHCLQTHSLRLPQIVECRPSALVGQNELIA